MWNHRSRDLHIEFEARHSERSSFAETREASISLHDAGCLLGIIRDRQIWATHTQYLNDRREFLHAKDLVRDETLSSFLEAKRLGSATRAEALDSMHRVPFRSPEHINVCVCSFSEDSDSLSQWRAYGGSSGFAIGFSPAILEAAVEKQGFFLAKCIYDPATPLDIVRALVEEVLDEHLSRGPVAEDELALGSDKLFWDNGGNLLDYVYRYAPILKDRSFEEEREWRIISKPILAPSLDFREGRSLIIPYYRLPLWEDGQKTEIHEIVVGPTRDVERSMRSLSRLIKGREVIKQGSDYTPIKASQVPYRDW